jgi:hypothetical protein
VSRSGAAESSVPVLAVLSVGRRGHFGVRRLLEVVRESLERLGLGDGGRGDGREPRRLRHDGRAPVVDPAYRVPQWVLYELNLDGPQQAH